MGGARLYLVALIGCRHSDPHFLKSMYFVLHIGESLGKSWQLVDLYVSCWASLHPPKRYDHKYVGLPCRKRHLGDIRSGAWVKRERQAALTLAGEVDPD